MTKQLGLAILFSLILSGAASSQGVTNHDILLGGGAGIRSNYITSTGETVPNPGLSQSGGTTSLDLGIQREDDKIEGSICKGC